ncbi:MAG: hypothetical protein WBE80_15635 [Methylocella sp.]
MKKNSADGRACNQRGKKQQNTQRSGDPAKRKISMPKEVATAIIGFLFAVILLIIGVFINSLFNYQPEVEYNVYNSIQLLPIATEFIPSATFIEFIQRLSEKTNPSNYDDQYFVKKLSTNKNAIELIENIGKFECATLINISNKSDSTVTNVTIVGPSSQGMIAEGPFGLPPGFFPSFSVLSEIPSFSELQGKKNIGELLPREAKEYLVLSKYRCDRKSFGSPTWSVVHDKGVAYFEEFPDTSGPLNLALRHQMLSFVLIMFGVYAVLILISIFTYALFRQISAALRTTAPPPPPAAAAAGDKPSGKS